MSEHPGGLTYSLFISPRVLHHSADQQKVSLSETVERITCSNHRIMAYQRALALSASRYGKGDQEGSAKPPNPGQKGPATGPSSEHERMIEREGDRSIFAFTNGYW